MATDRRDPQPAQAPQPPPRRRDTLTAAAGAAAGGAAELTAAPADPDRPPDLPDSLTRKRKCSYDNHRDHAGKPPPRRQQDREVLIP